MHTKKTFFTLIYRRTAIFFLCVAGVALTSSHSSTLAYTPQEFVTV